MEQPTQISASFDEQEGEDTPRFSENLLAAQSQPRPFTGPITSLPSGLGAISAPQSANPGMIGDFLFGGPRYGGDTLIGGANVAISGGDRVSKIAENTNPVPQDRVFFNYNSFNNASQDVNGQTQDLVSSGRSLMDCAL